MSDPTTMSGMIQFFAVRDLRNARRLILTAYSDLAFCNASPDAMGELGKCAAYLGRTLKVFARAERRNHKLSVDEKREMAKRRVLARLSKGPVSTTELAQFAGRYGVGYEMARQTMAELEAAGLIRCRPSKGLGGPITWFLVERSGLA